MILLQQCEEQSLRQRISQQVRVVHTGAGGKRRYGRVVHQFRGLEGADIRHARNRKELSTRKRVCERGDALVLRRGRLVARANVQRAGAGDSSGGSVWFTFGNK